MKPSDFFQNLGQPATYYPEMRKITGSLTSTVFFFNFYYWTGNEASKDGWIYKSAEQIEKETGLTYEEQKTARARLKRLGLMEEHYRRFEHLMYYRINKDMFDHLWWEVYPNSNIREQGNPSFGEQGNATFDPICTLLTTLPNRPSVKKKDPINYQAFMDTWNQNIEGTPFPKLNTIVGKRQKAITARLSEYPNLLEMIIPVIKYLSSIPYFIGDNKNKWVANFDYLMQDGKMNEHYEKSLSNQQKQTQEPRKTMADLEYEAAQVKYRDEMAQLQSEIAKKKSVAS